VKEIKLTIPGDLCDVMLEEALYKFRQENYQAMTYILSVSVFDAMLAVSYMIRQDNNFSWIYSVTIDPDFKAGEWQLTTVDKTAFLRSNA